MRHRRIILALGFIVILGAMGRLAYRPITRPTGPLVQVRFIEDSWSNGRALGHNFWVTNRSSELLLVSPMILETKESDGWHYHREWFDTWQGQLPSHTVMTGFLQPPPPGRPWRVRFGVYRKAQGLPALRRWLEVCRTPTLRQALGVSIWKMPPFGHSAVFWSGPITTIECESIE